MYHIHEDQDREKYVLLVPAMLDDHFPLLKYALYSKDFRPVILENEDGIVDLGLKYVNNDMCYPCILNVGQMIAALQSGAYPLDRTCLLMPTVGDSCRGSNYISALRKAVKAAGFPQVRVLSMNLRGLEKGNCVPIRLSMVHRALFAMFYGDMLMILANQLRPYEQESGAVENCRKKWFDRLGNDLKTGKHLTIGHLKRNFKEIAADFSAIPLTGEKKQRIGLLGDIYTKYCHLGNWSIVEFLEQSGCESYTGGLSWYVLYYIDSHCPEDNPIMEKLYALVGKALLHLQKAMIAALEEHDFYCTRNFVTMKHEAADYVSFGVTVGDGWLLGTEAVGMVKHGCPKVLAIHPFGCLPGHVCGKGFYPILNRKLPEGQIIAVDVDSSGSQVSLYNRAKILMDFPLRKE